MKKIEGKSVYYSDFLENKVEHFFTGRELIVKENIELISNYLKIDSNNLISPNQTHSSNIEIVDNRKEYPQTDGLIIDKNNKAIYLNFADCTPVILYDQKNNIASIVHCGWRGTVKKIAPKAILKMKEFYKTNPKDVIAVIGPCVSFKHFETSIDTINLLKESVKEVDELFNGCYANLKEINKRQLMEVGVKKIDIAPYCTIDDNDKFFSYRYENKTKSRFSAVLKLK